MGFQKYQKSEELKNVNKKENSVIKEHLAKTSKASVSEMTDEEKNRLNEDLQKENKNA